jgi:hypothetical protein
MGQEAAQLGWLTGAQDRAMRAGARSRAHLARSVGWTMGPGGSPPVLSP